MSIRSHPARWIIAAVVLMACVCSSMGAGSYADLQSDTWIATDALGRPLPTAAECGTPRTGRYVGIFYFLWLGQHGTSGPYDITKLLAANPTNPAWGPVPAFHHWGESELGYYLSDDEYVIRRHCHLLVDAGVDVLIFDVTNAFTYTSNYQLVCSVLSQIRAEGGRTPQICFLANSYSANVVQQLYNEFYSQNLYPDLWFLWQGKPLMLAPTDGLTEPVLSFFTFRQSWAFSDPNGWFGTGQDKWPWVDYFPQAYGWHTPGIPEQVAVSAAHHPVSNTGRSYHNSVEPTGANLQTASGPCFAEQGERALAIDPEFMFITGWNEWVAQRFLSEGNTWFLGRQLAAGETYFVDAYNQEYSRDIEPMKGGHTDNYYYQMISLIRRFKGVRTPDAPSAAKTVSIDGVFSDWTSVQPDYWDTPYDTNARNHAGWGSAGTYTNSTGRNDIVKCKVTYDATKIYFYAQTRSTMTSRTGTNWMLLFIDADHRPSTGWQGYDYVINYPTVSSSATTVKRNTGGWNWTSVGNASFRINGKELEISVPRSYIGQTGSNVSFDFHWADNIQKTDDITEFSISGDSAPNRRANYRFTTDTTPPADVANPQIGRSGANTFHVTWTNPADNDFGGTLIRFRTDRYPTGPSDGTWVCDRLGQPGVAEQLDFEASAVGLDKTCYFALFAHDGAGQFSQGVHALAGPGLTTPTIDAATLSDPVLLADGTTEYQLTVQMSDLLGLDDIKGLGIIFNRNWTDPSVCRGFLTWGPTPADVTYYTYSMVVQGAATGGGYWGFDTTNWGTSYISPVSCSTSSIGNQRTITWTFRVQPAWGTAGPATGNYIGMMAHGALARPIWYDSTTLFGYSFNVVSYPPPQADFNSDSHVDSIDFDFFSGCYNGPTNPASGVCLQSDFNGDHYVDANDFDTFSACYNGPTNRPGC